MAYRPTVTMKLRWSLGVNANHKTGRAASYGYADPASQFAYHAPGPVSTQDTAGQHFFLHSTGDDTQLLTLTNLQCNAV